ncbi:DUF2147 domain-containing protein [Tardiphaga alba]|uniref:DUF2147 domain-containing protein n=1 Tax=Tardiphaga alba TaxID=340268 RepID=A0ABX8A8D4_9BRAD|nr:DUF2147 domain-containing protein [Tardiphaga alba]QUS40004.1 DUF2147 domain-containing protein [Tardiphaga alba]
MKRFAAIAAILLATTAAQAADTYSFDIGGQSVTIDAPKDCNSADCVSISIPGVFEYNTKRIRRDRDRDNRESNTAPSPREERVRPAPPPTTAQPAQPAPAPVAAAPAAPATTATPPALSSAPSSNTPATAEPAKPAPSTVVANTPAADPAVKPAPSPVAAASPLGIWMTEKNEGKIRIENCGSDICGYAMDKKTEANGEKILINMKPGDSKWAGKIYDPKSGSTYDSTIALKGNDSLRVQGCAFGGMFCGGQTWTRVN